MRALRIVLAVVFVGVLGAAPPPAHITVKLIALNDIHGYLWPTETYGQPDPADPKKTVRVPVGGAAYLATAVARLEAENPLHAVVGSGDMVGASPLSSGLFHDEPTIEALNRIGLQISSVGNHEFDEGKAELMRKQHGGCRPGGTVGVDTCLTGRFTGANYDYLAANVIDDATGKTLFPPSAILYFDAGGTRVPIGFVGVVVRDTPHLTTAFGVRGVHFTDEAAAVNAQLPLLAAQGVHAVVVLIHQGAFTTSAYNDPACAGVHGDLLAVLDKLDPSIRLVLSAHTHQGYVCPNGQGTHNPHVFYIQAGRYGQMVSDVDVTIDVAHDTIVDVHGTNELIVNDQAPNPLAATLPALPPDPAIAALVERYRVATAPLVDRVIGHITADIPYETARDAAGETPMGDVIADARLAATQGGANGAVIAFVNGGGVRSWLHYTALAGTKQPGDVTYGDAYSIEPFGDLLYTETLTGAQIVELLNEQYAGESDDPLAISRGLTYTWDASLPAAAKVVPGSVQLNGAPLNPVAAYRITVDAFMAEGGDGYTVLRSGTNKTAGPIDIQALDAYLTAHAPLAPPVLDRIVRLH
jgi:5'-nucleotidase